jgi:signal transduction histidine kinase
VSTVGEADSQIPTSIMIVDDHPGNRTALHAVLAPMDCCIVEASSGQGALQALLGGADDFAVLLLDVVMPEMNGFELASVIKLRKKTATVPIVFLTAEAADVDFIFRGYQVGAVDYLVKPLVPEMVRAKVAVFVDLYRQRKRIERQAALLVDAERRDSERRLLELRLAGEQRLRSVAEAAVVARDEFLSIASHELRTPLSSLQLQIDMLLSPRASGDGGPESVAVKLRRAAAQIERLSRLVSELMDASRIAVGHFRVEPEPVDLAALAGDVVERFREAATKMQTGLEFRAPQPVPGLWDRTRIDQVVTNLLANALKFGAGRPVEVEVSSDGSRARLLVRDHGVGIAPQDVDRVFHRYERGATARHYGGLGLGLYIVSQIVDAHGGTIQVESKPDEGSTFVVELPLEPRQEKQA